MRVETEIGADSPMRDVLENLPGVRQPLFGRVKPLAEFRSKD